MRLKEPISGHIDQPECSGSPVVRTRFLRTVIVRHHRPGQMSRNARCLTQRRRPLKIERLFTVKGAVHNACGFRGSLQHLGEFL